MNRQPLFRKYVAVFVILVSGALITSGLVQLYFSYQENQAALLSIQREKAAGAATRIEQFLQETERQIGGSIQVGPAGTLVSTDRRRSDYLRLLPIVATRCGLPRGKRVSRESEQAGGNLTALAAGVVGLLGKKWS